MPIVRKRRRAWPGALGDEVDGEQIKFLFGILESCNPLMGLLGRDRALEGIRIWLKKTAVLCVFSEAGSGRQWRMPLAIAAKRLKRPKTAMGAYWKKLAWIWVWRRSAWDRQSVNATRAIEVDRIPRLGQAPLVFIARRLRFPGTHRPTTAPACRRRRKPVLPAAV
jgi:hypothetical protein